MSGLYVPVPGPKFTIGPNQNGDYLVLGDPALWSEMGGFLLEFVPDLSFNGSISIMARNGTIEAGEAELAPTPQPFRAFYLNGAAVASPDFVAIGTVITGRSRIMVPASGQFVILSPAATSAGQCVVYAKPLAGTTIP